MPRHKTTVTQLSPTLHTLSRPFSRFNLLKIGARSTILTLSDGSLAITSPLPLSHTDPLPLTFVRETLGGRVRFLIAPDLAHFMGVRDWVDAFPGAIVIGVSGHDQKTRGRVRWDVLVDAGTDVRDVLNRYSVSQDLDFCYFPGFIGKDLVTLHKSSKSIVEADLLFNLPAMEQYGGKPPGGLTTLMNVLRKDSVWSRWFLQYVGCKDEAQMRESAAVVGAWDFDIIVPCHGDVITSGGKQVWNWVFYKYLSSSKK